MAAAFEGMGEGKRLFYHSADSSNVGSGCPMFAHDGKLQGSEASLVQFSAAPTPGLGPNAAVPKVSQLLTANCRPNRFWAITY
jgi:hypothetical protein